MTTQSQHDRLHLAIIGGGSAAFAAAIEAHRLGARVTIINDGLPIGGTCVNVGCVPSKALLRAAEARHQPMTGRFDGIEPTKPEVDFQRVIAQKRQLVDTMRARKYIDVIEPLERVEYIEGRATFSASKTLVVEDEEFEADCILIATGATPSVPPIQGVDDVAYLTSQTAFELDELPDSMVVLGGGYVGLECAQMFSRFGTQVTVVEMEAQILPAETKDVAYELQVHLREEGVEIRTSSRVKGVESTLEGIALEMDGPDGAKRLEAERLLVATGRSPNTDALGVEKAEITLDKHSYVTVDSYLQTTADGVYAAGDVIGLPMFVYTAAYEGKIAARNAVGDEASRVDYGPLPRVVFTDPQVAAVGLDECQAEHEGFNPEVAKLSLSEVPRAIAARDTRGFIKLIRDRSTDRLLGARIVAPEGSELLMELAVAIDQQMTIDELTGLLHPYLTLSEGIRLAAKTFDQSVDELSCCAG